MGMHRADKMEHGGTTISRTRTRVTYCSTTVLPTVSRGCTTRSVVSRADKTEQGGGIGSCMDMEGPFEIFTLASILAKEDASFYYLA
jgi:hypothetical protein